MITWRTLARLTPHTTNLCSGEWFVPGYGKFCRSSGMEHTCVGDAGHLGKHVCRCGARRNVTA